MKTKRREVIFVTVLCLFLLGSTIAYVKVAKIKTPQGSNKVSVSQNNLLRRGALQSFEDSLNDFLRQVGFKMQDYRQDRAILFDLAEPRNLKDPSFAEQNYKLALEIFPSLRKQMDALLSVFESKEAEVQKLLSSQPQDVRSRVWRQWKSMKDKQLSAFITYFMYDDQILTAYQELLYFYYMKRQRFHYDRGSNRLVFDSPDDQDKVRAMLEDIRLLKAQQASSAQ